MFGSDTLKNIVSKFFWFLVNWMQWDFGQIVGYFKEIWTSLARDTIG